MAQDVSMEMQDEMGAAAGVMWRCLNENGPMSCKELKKKTKMKRALLRNAIGWLACEGKLSFQKSGRETVMALR